MNKKVREVLENILERFKSGDIPKAITYATFPIPNVPSAKWSFTNRLIMIISGTSDARGIRQWNRAGRTVRKGAKAIYILVPRFVKAIDPDDANEERFILKGFMAQPVFRAEDTEGEPLEYEKKIPLPDLPLMEKAKEWGISVTAVPPFSKAYGVYIADYQEILLASPEEIVFFHELSHAGYERAVEKLKPGQRWDQEITAELCAQVICRIVGRQPRETIGNSYRYIERYARDAGLSPLLACLHVLDCVEKVLSLILGREKKETNDPGDVCELKTMHDASHASAMVSAATIQREVI
jgi:hypothetical protein